MDVLQTPSQSDTPTSPSEANPVEYPSDIRLTGQIIKLNQTISALIDHYGKVDGNVKYLDIPEDRMLMVAYNFLFGAKMNKEAHTLRLFRTLMEAPTK